MAPDRGRNRASEFADLLESAPRDIDPEVEGEQTGSSHDDDGSGDDGADAREHYSEVEKSKLRKPRDAAVGPQYRGSRVSRDAVAEDEEDDPFQTFDDGVKSDIGSQDSDVDSADEDVEEDGETSDTDMSVDDEPPGPQQPETQPNRRELLEAVARDQKAVKSSLANSIKADAEKGRAVKRQKTSFDSLLNTRIKLQKSLVVTNSLPETLANVMDTELSEQQAVVEAAETAAFKLWSTLNILRDDIIAQRAGEKRKRESFSSSTSSVTLWRHMQAQEERSLPHRNAALQRWSNKVRNANVVPERGVNKSAQQTTIVDALNEHLSNRDRLIKRTQTPRSCAPIQHAAGVMEDSRIYDDADFYGILLKELLEQKSADSVTAAHVDINFNLKRETKAKKNVDTKASKGRKLRYTVHEKLQNFMAPEDRGTWSERQADELFRSLFGSSRGLGEQLQESEAEEDGEGVGDDGFVLFRT